MQIGINTWVWASPLTDERLERLIPHIAALGFDRVELPIENIGDWNAGPARTLAARHRLGISVCGAFGPERDFLASGADVRNAAAAYLRHCIDIAEAVGAANVVGPFYSAVGRVRQIDHQQRETDLGLLVQQLRPLAHYAADRGVTLCLEPLNRFETSVFNTVAQANELVDRVDHPALGLLLDTFHMNIEERSIGDAIRLAGRRLRHFHACENDRGAPGSGHIPWDDVARALHDVRYDGPVVIESFSAEVKSIARAAAIWRPLASSQDALAEDGLRFLRGLLG